MRVLVGAQTSFLDDAWCTSQPLKMIYLELYEMCDDEKIIVSYASGVGGKFRYIRWPEEHNNCG